jgi:hypothetical protein
MDNLCNLFRMLLRTGRFLKNTLEKSWVSEAIEGCWVILAA